MIDSKAFNKIDAADKEIVTEVMTRVFSHLDETTMVKNKEAYQALLNTGIESVELDEYEIAEIRDVLLKSNRDMAKQGEFSLDLYDQMMRYVQEYRTGDAGAAGN